MSACGGNSADGNDGNGTNPGGGSGAGGGINTDGGGRGGDDCGEAAKLVYVISDDANLYSFSPDALKFTLVGSVKCPVTGGATPFSMAVDRAGGAWVVYSDGNLFKVSTGDASCSATSYKPPTAPANFVTFGMGFSANASGSKDETLFVSDSGQNNTTTRSAGVATLDTSSLTRQQVGPFTGVEAGRACELTGTGDARLFGFFSGASNTAAATLAEIDKTSGATLNSTELKGVSVGNAWAYSFWGGDFWFYTASGNSSQSKVTRYKYASDKSISVVVPSAGFRIVGAGVSTCAPTTPTTPN